jgi:site-specific DNA recombinase
MRVLVAARLSRLQRGGRAGLGIDTQDEYSRKWAIEQGHEVIDTAGDTKKGTVAPWDRPNLRPWVTDPERMAMYDGIVAYKNDRLSRGVWADEARIRLWAEENGKTLLIVNGPQWPPRDSGDKALWESKADSARQEWEEDQERSLRNQKALRDAGKLTSKPPWGYESAGEKYEKTMVPTETARVYIPKIFARVADGMALAKVGAWLESKGVVSSAKSGKWWSSSIAFIIRNTTYKGFGQNAKGITIIRVEPLVDAGLWKRANDALSTTKRGRRGPDSGAPALLTGVLFCNRCGSPMYRIRPPRHDYSYRCAGKGPQRKGCGLMLDLDSLDILAINYLSNASEPWTTVVPVPGDDHSSEIEERKAERADLFARLNADEITFEQFTARSTEISAEIDRLGNLPRTLPTVRIEATGETVGQHFTRLDREGKRVMMREAVKLYADKLELPDGTTVPMLRVDSRLFAQPVEWLP